MEKTRETNMEVTVTPPADRSSEFSAGTLVIGLALVALGAASLLDASDVWYPWNLVRYWPVALILIGVANEIDAIRRRKSDGSWVLAAVGVWMLGVVDAVDLSTRTTFPLAVVTAGIALVIHALVDVPKEQVKENGHER